MSTADDGFGVVEALVAVALAAVAFGALASATQVATRALRRTSAQQAAVAAATERLETLRTGARDSGGDAAAGSPAVVRTWRHTPGRGRPDLLAVDTECDGSRLGLASAVWP